MSSRSHIIWILALLVGCIEGSTVPEQTLNNAQLNSPALTLGSPTASPTLGHSDAGTCVNTVVQVPYEYPDDCRSHICFDYETCAQTPTSYIHNPPIAGPHYWIWADWGIHQEVVPRGYWVHNLEHGAVVFLYNPNLAQQSLIDAIIRVYNAIPLLPPSEWPDCCLDGMSCPNHRRVLVTPDPLLDAPWAVTVSGPEEFYCFGFGYYIKGDCIESEQALVDFAVQHRSMGAETLCDEGAYPPP